MYNAYYNYFISNTVLVKMCDMEANVAVPLPAVLPSVTCSSSHREASAPLITASEHFALLRFV